MATPLPSLAELGGCIFGKPANKHGYAYRTYQGKQIKAHRAAYMEAHGEIPKGMMVDHLCHAVAIANEMCLGEDKCIHRSCVNPEHLRLLTPYENQMEGLRSFRYRKRCKNGHELTEDNIRTRKRSDGRIGQICLTCYRAYTQRAAANFRAKQKAMKEAEQA